MRELYHIMVFWLCLMAFAACEVEFDFKELDGDPLFLLDGAVKSEPYSPSTSNFQMYLYAVPSAAGEREFSEEARCTLKVYRNSVLIDTKDYITIQSFFGLIADEYPVKPGDEVLVTAESAGFPTASSRTVIPQAPPAVEASFSMSGDNLNIRFSFEDDADTDDAYAVCFRTISSRYRPDDAAMGTTLDLSFGNSSESSLPDSGPFDVTWEDGYRYYGIFDDSFNGRIKEFEVTAPFSFPSGDEKSYFRIELQRISPERLRYEIACNDKSSNVLGFIGLAPVTFAYTNVSGGSGCFSSGNSGYSDWTEVVPDGR